ncbi:hypothetical protein D9M68_992230 [compost metagenome]
MSQLHHQVKAFYLRPHEVVKIMPVVSQHVQDHTGNGSFTVATGNDHPFFIFTLFKYIFGERIYPDTQLLSHQKLRIIFSGMHTQDHRVKITGDPCLVPSGLGR